MLQDVLQTLAAFDTWLFQIINGFVGTVPFFDRFMATVVNEYLMPVSIALAVFALWFVGGSPAARSENQRAVLYAFLAQPVANGIIGLNNSLYFRPRPFAALPVKMLFYEPTDSSMPSNPAAVGFAFATAVWLVNRRAGAVLYAFAALFAISRVYCGVHYPLDIVGGATVGIVGAAIAVTLARTLLAPVAEGIIALARRLYLA